MSCGISKREAWVVRTQHEAVEATSCRQTGWAGHSSKLKSRVATERRIRNPLSGLRDRKTRGQHKDFLYFVIFTLVSQTYENRHAAASQTRKRITPVTVRYARYRIAHIPRTVRYFQLCILIEPERQSTQNLMQQQIFEDNKSIRHNRGKSKNSFM